MNGAISPQRRSLDDTFVLGFYAIHVSVFYSSTFLTKGSSSLILN